MKVLWCNSSVGGWHRNPCALYYCEMIRVLFKELRSAYISRDQFTSDSSLIKQSIANESSNCIHYEWRHLQNGTNAYNIHYLTILESLFPIYQSRAWQTVHFPLVVVQHRRCSCSIVYSSDLTPTRSTQGTMAFQA